MIEAQLAYILDCLRAMTRRGLHAVEVRPEVEAAYNAALQRRLRDTVWRRAAPAGISTRAGNSTLWPGFTSEYRWRTRRFDPANYLQTAGKSSHEAATVHS